MTAATDLFVEEARAVSVGEAAERLGVLAGLKRSTAEWVGPCPACGGTDRFSVNPGKGAWNCRGDRGGKDGIGLARHVRGLDLDRREEFLLACAEVLGRPVPEGTPESAEAADERARRLEERRRQNAERAEADAAAQAGFREGERAKARGKWQRARPGGIGLDYLAARLGCSLADLPQLPFLRSLGSEPYWHGQDERQNPIEIFAGPAMILPFIDPAGAVIGCHITWIDMAGRKRRPSLIDEEGEPLPTKKMRGSKKGGLIPLVGFIDNGGLILPDARRHRLVAGEGIENTIAVALAEGFRADTLYAPAGDLGNLAGPADPSSAFSHPVLKNKGGKAPLRVSGPVPREGQGADEAMQVPGWVREIMLVADGDSERFATAAAMARALSRLAASDRRIAIAWPPEGADFADMVAGGIERKAA
ncbi:hypothetical protein Sa4125_25270 [Aureimonas sp. SA4125]|uniref:DUF7146 domain-containing protein n=1 Tax=Aureimonas sp. SA4125 TaxID=2826993 RepID=UPI001CC74690|nr:hypothetical protein [Aureimonas sp. SA4125]BDA84985.1 hypothetical protein Sa4125_25270 [Aureimonas sp. SA4125]